MALGRCIVLVVFLLLIVAAPVWANTADVPNLPRVEQPIKVDGSLDDEAWRHALRIDVDTETGPGENTPAPVKTVAYLRPMLEAAGARVSVFDYARNTNQFLTLRQKGARALADDFAGVARLDYMGLPGLLVGASVYYGQADQNQAFVGPDSLIDGRLAGEFTAMALEDREGELVIVELIGALNDQNGIDRSAGFREGISTLENVTIIEVPTDWDSARALSGTQNAFQANLRSLQRNRQHPSILIVDGHGVFQRQVGEEICVIEQNVSPGHVVEIDAPRLAIITLIIQFEFNGINSAFLNIAPGGVEDGHIPCALILIDPHAHQRAIFKF